MTLAMPWDEIVLRLALTVVAGVAVGLNRSEGGHAAGLRTTLLVCLAASVAMIQMNILLPMRGKAPDSYASLDLMRLPLGILTGMGFIGGGAIMRRGDLVHGVTTAATLWLVTIIGLCLGGGQIGLGMTALGLTLATLWGLKWLEARLSLPRVGRLKVVVAEDGPSGEDLQAGLAQAGIRVVSWGVTTRRRSGKISRTIRCRVRWRDHPDAFRTPPAVAELARHPGILACHWEM